MTSLLRSGRRLLQPTTSIRRYSPAAAPAPADDEEPFDQRNLPTDYDPATFDPAQHRSPPTPRVWRLVDEVSALTLTELSALNAILMGKLRTEPPVIAVMRSGAAGTFAFAGKGAGGDGAKEEKKPEKTVFELRLESFEAASKIKVIKEVRGFTELGLKEAKELVEKAPVVIKGGLSKEDAEKIIEKMKGIGAKVVME